MTKTSYTAFILHPNKKGATIVMSGKNGNYEVGWHSTSTRELRASWPTFKAMASRKKDIILFHVIVSFLKRPPARLTPETFRVGLEEGVSRLRLLLI